MSQFLLFCFFFNLTVCHVNFKNKIQHYTYLKSVKEAKPNLKAFLCLLPIKRYVLKNKGKSEQDLIKVMPSIPCVIYLCLYCFVLLFKICWWKPIKSYTYLPVSFSRPKRWYQIDSPRIKNVITVTAIKWDLFPQNERQVARKLKEIWLTEHVNNQ